MRLKVVAVVCANGRGHWKRSSAILRAASRPGWQLTVITETPESEVRRALGESTRVVSGVVSPGPGWTQALTEDRLLGWESRLEQVAALRSADVVISDNLPQVLAIRPDAVLLGSFLWGDILATAYPENVAVQRFAMRETELLTKFSPRMICVRGLTMPAVHTLTRANEVGLMSDFTRVDQREPSRVALLGGGTGSASSALEELARELEGNVELTGSAELASRCPGVTPFDFTPQSWGSLSVAIVRPGMGTLTDAITARVPVLALPEPENPEMDFLAAAIEKMGVGRRLQRSFDTAGQIRSILGKRDDYQRSVAKVSTRGISEAASLLFPP